jgi:hypothetical protein
MPGNGSTREECLEMFGCRIKEKKELLRISPMIVLMWPCSRNKGRPPDWLLQQLERRARKGEGWSLGGFPVSSDVPRDVGNKVGEVGVPELHDITEHSH